MEVPKTMWQVCDIMTDHVITLWQVMWQHHDSSCANIMTGHVTTSWLARWHHDRLCDNIMTGHMTTLWQIMWHHHDRPCDNIMTGHVTILWQVMWQHHDRPCGNIVTGNASIMLYNGRYVLGLIRTTYQLNLLCPGFTIPWLYEYSAGAHEIAKHW